MNDTSNKPESTASAQSSSTEAALVRVGFVLYESLMSAKRLDEVEILMNLISEYSTTASNYGDAVGTTPESLGVDLSEAALLKRESLRLRSGSMEWQVYADQFIDTLKSVAQERGVDVKT